MTYRVCLVCMGNICRSPMAEVVLRQKLADQGLAGRVSVESSGTGGWHEGDPMDERALRTLAENGYDGSAHRARQFRADDYDLVLVMDKENLRNLRRMAPEVEAELFDPQGEVPDPYYDGRFLPVLRQVEAAAEGVVKRIADEIG
ncbi:low molecular weight protein-tyrosine-phosphatase [Nonomuraea sp. NPDC050556]|uniref:low molecular weight protein-tyrosine-phosphatase n=1 Tax=Nonomuraea sp. NPDC050556 TaxID=3364369 RepID=UPI00379150CE